MVAIIKVLLLLAASLIAATSGESYPASKHVEFVPISDAGNKQVVTIELKAEDAKDLSEEKYKQLHYAILNALKNKRRNQHTPGIYDRTTDTEIHATTKATEATTEVITAAKTSTPEPTTTMQEPTTTMQEPTTTMQKPTTTMQEPTTTMQKPTTTTQAPTTTMQEPTTTMQEPTTTMQEPTTTMQEPTTTTQEPTTTMQEPTTTMQEPTTTMQEPTTTVQEPTTTMQEPTATVPEPTTTMQELTTTMQEPTTTVQEPTTTVPEPTTTVPEATTTMQEPSTTVQEPTTTVQEPSTTVQEPTTTVQEPTTTTPEPTTSQPTTPQPTTATTTPMPVDPNKRRKRDSSSTCDDEKEYSEKDLFFISLDDVFKDDILRIPFVLHKDDCEVPRDLLFDVSQELNSTGDLEDVVGKEVENIYRGLPVDVVVEIKAVKVSSHHFWLPILLTISFLVVLVVLSAIYCLVFWKRKSYAVQQENYIAVKGRDNPLTDIEMTMDEGPVYVHTNGHVHHAPIILTDDDGRIVPMSEFNDDEPPHQTNLTKDSTIL